MSQKIHIAIVNEGTAGGIRKRIFNVARWIDPERFQVTVILSGNRKGYIAEEDPLEELNRLGIPHIYVPMVREISAYYDLRSLHLLRKTFRKHRFDIVHAHSAKAGFLTRLAARLDSIQPCFYSPHVFPFQRVSGFRARSYLALERIAAPWCTAFVVDSQGEKDCAVKLGLSTPEKIFVLPDAVPLPEDLPENARSTIRNSLGAPQDRIVFLTAARLVAYKGHEQLIRAFSGIKGKHPIVELWIAGDGEERRSLEKVARESGVSGSVRFLGHRKDIYEIIPGCDCFVLASRAEGSPHSILEALALEKPIIATEVQGTIEFLKDPAHCRLVPWNDVPALSSAMLHFVQSPFPGAPLSSLPREWFDIRGQIQKLEQIYLQPLQAHNH